MTAASASDPTTGTAALPSTTRLLLPFALAMIAANAILQIVIATTGNQIDLLAGALTAVIFVASVAFVLLRRRDLGRIRFGFLAAHVVLFAAVNSGFSLHFFVLGAAGSAVLDGDGAAGWFGPAVAMPAFWGLGLLIHSLGAILDRGFEARR